MRQRLGLFAFLAGMAAGNAAVAHPHVFIEVQAGFRFDTEGRLVSLEVTWTYDAFTSLMLFDILELDKDGDGQLNDEDRAMIVKGETDWPEGYEGDTYLEANGLPVALTRPVDGSAWMADDRVGLAFDLPLQAPFDPANDLVLRFYDPSFYYAYEVVALEGALPDGCRTEIIPFEPDAALAELQQKLAALSREETPEQENVGRLFADEVWLRCD
jgi:ABC-type uncharacterized transport system substrate-binding protein